MTNPTWYPGEATASTCGLENLATIGTVREYARKDVLANGPTKVSWVTVAGAQIVETRATIWNPAQLQEAEEILIEQSTGLLTNSRKTNQRISKPGLLSNRRKAVLRELVKGQKAKGNQKAKAKVMASASNIQLEIAPLVTNATTNMRDQLQLFRQ